jgi:hypothetical protein
MARFALLAAGIWGTVLRPAAYEVRGTMVARPAPDMIVIAHDAIPSPGDRLRLAARQEGDRLLVLRVEKLR